MNSEDFVGAVKLHVLDSAIADTTSNLRVLSTKKPSSEDLARSQWYNALSARDKSYVDGIIAAAAFRAVFGFLAVLDGARKIDDENGVFLLYHEAAERTLLNDFRGTDLHDILRSLL
jgi:hypothetical protein